MKANMSLCVGHGLWTMQTLSCLLLVVLLSGFLYWNYSIRDYPFVCSSNLYDPWIKNYLTLVCGASLGQMVLQYFRVFVATQGFTDGKLRHPRATILILLICTIQTIGIVFYQYDLVPYTCTDFLGIKTPPFLWFEWICTVPFMFFLISTMDVKETKMTVTDWKVQILGGMSIPLLGFGNFTHSPRWLLWLSFIAANIFMTYALLLQLYSAYDKYSDCYETYLQSIRKDKPITSNGGSPQQIIEEQRKIYDQYMIAQGRMNSSLFVSIFFSIFPILYYLKYLEIIDQEVMIVTVILCSYLSKVMFSQILFDSHIEILDPNKFLLLEERKKSEETRLMFLRYVFHEVRVPLNSISLGIQLLQESESLLHEDQETLSMMREATHFMSETLNDVLSLQKIEEGMLQLEYRPFTPLSLVQAVLQNFKTQSDAKGIEMTYEIDSNVPAMVLGDEFRLEHVLGNLVSNAIKFSDINSKIEIYVSYGTKVTGQVTFAVRDYGPGMSPEEQSLLFQPFMQIRPGELQKGRGSGLGLSICKTIVTLHHGTIGCSSTKRSPGMDPNCAGSEFYFNVDFAIPEDDVVVSMMEEKVIQEEEKKKSTDGNDSVNSRAPSCAVPRSTLIDQVLSLSNEDFDDDNNSSNHRSQGSGSHHTNGSNSSNHHRRKLFQAMSDYSPKLSFSPKQPSSHVLKNTNLSSFSELDFPQDKDMPSLHPVSQPILQPRETKVEEPKKEVKPTEPRFQSIQRVLVVDDVLSNRKMLDMLLKRKGVVHVDQAGDGQEVLERIQAKGIAYYDLIFMDSIMPILSGPETATELRKLGYQNLMIGVTGNAMEEDVLSYEAAGVDLVLAKPVKGEKLTLILQYGEEITKLSQWNRGSSFEVTLPNVKNWIAATESR